MREHLPVGCQSHDSTVDIRYKLEINYLRRRGNSSHAGRNGGRPNTRRRTSWCKWIQPCKLSCLVGPQSFYNKSGCVCTYINHYLPDWRFCQEGGLTADGADASFSINLRSSQPASFLPLLQLTPLSCQCAAAEKLQH